MADVYKLFLEYATNGVKYNSEIDTIERFFFTFLWLVPTPEWSSADLKRTLREIYLRNVANDRLLGKTEFLDKITGFIDLEKIEIKGVNA